jgi:hydroxyacylglutathione hydrolase
MNQRELLNASPGSSICFLSRIDARASRRNKDLMRESVKHAVVLLVFFSGILATTLAIFICSASSVELQHISAEELKKLIESKSNILVVDVQPKVAYEVGHIKGAINFLWAKEIKGPVKLPKNKPLVIYCDCTHEEDSTDVGTQLIEKFGYDSNNIKVLTGGWSGWVKLGYATEKGKGKK